MLKKVRYLILIIVLSGCAGTQADKYADIVEEWQGKQLIIPDTIIDVATGEIININNVGFTILTYVDSTECADCTMVLPWWDNIMQALDTIPDADTNILMVVHSKDKREVLSLLKRHSYRYPVYLDKYDTIDSLNEIPNNPMFQTFLLDKSMRVIAIGNPVYSPSLYDLYFSIITGEQTVATKADITVKVENNLEKPICLKVGESYTHEFVLSNLGNDTVFVSKITSSCDCTTTRLSKEFIAPKEKLKAMVHIRGDSITGPFVRIVNINYVGFDYPSVIRLVGTIG